MKPRTKRTFAIVVGLSSLGLAAFMVLKTFQSNLVFFFSPSEVFAQEAPRDRAFRIGGLVAESSIERDPSKLRIKFEVTDLAHSIPVIYEGLLPDLFQEGKGVVAQGRLDSNGIFVADQVLAKHDENYMPPEAAEALEKAAKIKNQTTSTLVVPEKN
jgi:cytochrome c-type biogenesis protein CcmE